MEGLGKSSFGWSLSAPRSSVRFQPPLWIPKVCSFSLEECVEGRRYVGSCSCGKKKKKDIVVVAERMGIIPGHAGPAGTGRW